MRPAIAAVLVLSGEMLIGQTLASKLKFEAVSVKPTSETVFSLMRSGRPTGRVDDAQAVYGSIQMSALVQNAFEMPSSQIIGPEWMGDARYEISAKLPQGSTQTQIPEMLQAMLADRFQMKIHHEQRLLLVYFLAPGNASLKIKPTVPGDATLPGCDAQRGGMWVCRNVTMEVFVKLMPVDHGGPNPASASESWALDRPLVDKTGLRGAYDLTMQMGVTGGGRRGGAPDEPIIVSTTADALKAVGFALQPGKAPFDFLIIEKLERTPTQN